MTNSPHSRVCSRMCHAQPSATGDAQDVGILLSMLASGPPEPRKPVGPLEPHTVLFLPWESSVGRSTRWLC